jgi:hypothetical protein
MKKLLSACGIVVALASASFVVATPEPAVAAQPPSYPLYCQGPLQITRWPWYYTWAPTAAGVAPPGPGQCAWADRTPRGDELMPAFGGGYYNLVCGALTAGIYEPQPSGVDYSVIKQGQYMEIGVYYNDPPEHFERCMAWTTVVGFVTPPFSASPTLPWLGLPPGLATGPPHRPIPRPRPL